MEPKIITVAQQKGGAGKTTIAVHLAVAFMQKGLRVAAIDIDPQGSFTAWHAEREKRFGEGYTGLTFRTLTGWRLGSELPRLKREHNIVVIDSPPHTETEARTAIRHADLILLPVQPSPTDLWATQATVDLAGVERIPFKLVLNRVSPKAKLGQVIGSKLEKIGPVSKARVGNRVAFAGSILEGRAVTETQPSSPAAQEVKALVDDVMAFFRKQDKAAQGAEAA